MKHVVLHEEIAEISSDTGLLKRKFTRYRWTWVKYLNTAETDVR